MDGGGAAAIDRCHHRTSERLDGSQGHPHAQPFGPLPGDKPKQVRRVPDRQERLKPATARTICARTSRALSYQYINARLKLSMKILVKVKASAKKEMVERAGEPAMNTRNTKILMDFYIVWVKEPAVDGKANEAVVRAIANHLKVPTSKIKIKSGRESRQKVLEIV